MVFGVTLISATIDLGSFNTGVLMLIATVKALLVALFFMHLSESDALERVFAATGVFWLAVLITLALSDYLSRSWLALPGRWPQ